ncbi:uncharacterized protein LOC108416135 [Pygocentrus nattereri]|nr:uncharacterized protein LOC108416135 [Pygocentrus nattereri]
MERAFLRGANILVLMASQCCPNGSGFFSQTKSHPWRRQLSAVILSTPASTSGASSESSLESPSESASSLKSSQWPSVFDVYCPSFPSGETAESLERVRVTLLSEVKKKDNEQTLKVLMDKTFALRRHEVIHESPLIADFKTRWPALFRTKEVSAEFERITTVHLLSRFFSKLDLHSAKLLKVFAKRGGVQGRKIMQLVTAMAQSDNVEVKRESVLRALCLYLIEEPDDLIREYMVSDVAAIQQGIDGTVLGIYTTRVEGAEVMDHPADVGVVIEGVVVLEDLASVSLAIALLLGLIYAFNLSYPPKFRYTFEVIQKLFLDLDANKLSHKVQALKTKLFSELESG